MSVEKDNKMEEGFLTPVVPAPDAHEIVNIVERHQTRQRIICKELEAIADSLPLDVDPSLCMRLARGLLPTLHTANKYREDYFWELARRFLSETANIDAIIERLRAEYFENELLAEEVAEELSQWGMCADHNSAEAMGYMLRGFFIGLTRHLDFERVVLLEPVRTRLSRPEVAEYPEP
ncbi:hypothetical protein [Hwanghaeella sp.]|uniref:hypothetical protein n=1 Tax=Hwanghaeella sp. TaxID=2605943 RepID=UPI003CCC4295